MNTYKIAVGLITVDYKVHWCQVASFLKMLPKNYSNYEFEPIFEQGIYLDELRNRVAMKFLNTDADYLLFLDYDNGLHEDALEYFMEDLSNPDIHIVSGAYKFKNERADYVAGFSQPEHPRGTYLWVGDNFFSKPLINLTKVGGGSAGIVGAGCLMIRRSVFTTVKYPWFMTSWGIANKGVMFWGEDTGFCRNAEEAGIDIYLDQRIRSPHMAGDRCYPEEWRQFPKVGGFGQGDPLSQEVNYE